jgi:pimeloyl-ACP methyl ester carboxylesterase
MKNFREWGEPPYKVAVIHGGPGAPGSISPVARKLSKDTGVLEPLQTADSIKGQVTELHSVLQNHAELPVTLVGWSWGATLSYVTAARYPDIVKKLILIGTPPLEDKVRPDLTPIWLDRLSEAERVEFTSLENFVWGGAEGDKSASMGRLFRLIARAETLDPMPHKDDVLEYQLHINIAVGLEMRKLLASGKLTESGKQITCPVTAIHGDYDPRSAEVVRDFLSHVLKEFKFVLLEKCGHYPWVERHARGEFFRVLREEIA